MAKAGALRCALLVGLSLLAAPVSAARVQDHRRRAAVVPPDLLEQRIELLNNTVYDIIEGRGLLPMKLRVCITTCPGNWAMAARRASKMRRAALEAISAQVGERTDFDVRDLALVRPQAAAAYKRVLRSVAWTFLRAVDTALYQRVLLTLLGSQGFVGRKLTGLAPMGFCVFQRVWAEMIAAGTEQYSPAFWRMFFAGCPPAEQALPQPFADAEAAFRLADGMAFAVGQAGVAAAEGDEERAEEARLWAGAPTFSACVVKRARLRGEWITRLVTVERGVLKWRKDRSCGHIFGSSDRSASLALLTAPQGQEPVQLYGRSNKHRCILMRNPYRLFRYCAVKRGGSLKRMKEVVDAHLQILGERREAMAAAAELGRLVLHSGGERLAEEAAQAAAAGEDTVKEGEKGESDVAAAARDLRSFAEDAEGAEGGGGAGPAASEEQQMAQEVIDLVRSGAGAAEDADEEEDDDDDAEDGDAGGEGGALVERAAALAGAGGRSGFVVLGSAAIASSAVTTSVILTLVGLCQGQNCLADAVTADGSQPPMESTLLNVTGAKPL